MLALSLAPIKVKLPQLLLDPNNPRFSELGEELDAIPEARFPEEKIQASTMEKMKDKSFDVSELRDTIKTIGFLPMDRIVVRRWPGKESALFVVVEGNRRVTALKWLVDLHEKGKESFTPDQLKNFTELEVLELDTGRSSGEAGLILPGLRHVSGVKEWGPYQKAKAVHALRSRGRTAQEAAQSLGLSTRAANKFYRCYLALEQMKADEEYGELAHPKLFSYFEETFKEAPVRDWLEWDDDQGKFTSESRLREFYSWIVPDAESDSAPRLPEAKSLRELGAIINDEQAFVVFRSRDGSLSRALARYQTDHPDEWMPKVMEAVSAIRGLTAIQLRELKVDEENALRALATLISNQLSDRQALLGAKSA